MVLITLPFPNYYINSISIITCFNFWLLHNSIRVKYKNLKKNFLSFIILSSLFWISLFGLLYTQDTKEGLRNLEQNLPFLVFPLVFLSINLEKSFSKIIFKYFSYSVLIASLFALLKAFFFKVNNLGEFFFFDQLSKLLDKHTTYFALFIVIAISYFLNELLLKKWKNIIMVLFLFLMLYMLSVRISIVGLIFIFLILTMSLKNIISSKKHLLIFALCLMPLLVYFTTNFQKRFNTKTPEGIEISDISSRKTHWEAVISHFKKDNLFFGSGTGDGHIGLYEEYKKFNFETGYFYKYNAHNQYLETLLFYGLFGLFFLFLIIYIALRNRIRVKDYLGVAIIVVFIVFMCTESILERHSGIVLFSYIMSLLTSTSNKKIHCVESKLEKF